MGVATSLVRPQGWKALVCGVAIAGAVLAGSPAGAAPTVPGAPTITGATSGLRSVTVTYSAPANDGGAPITEYRVACSSSDGGASKSTTEHASPTTVRNLTAGKTYTCNVEAGNRKGFGPPSALSAPVVTLSPPVITVPGAPTITSATAGFHSVTVAFTPPAGNGGASIFLYKATCTSSNGGHTRSNLRSHSSIRVGDLSSGKTYTCTVAARNRKGFGAASAPSAAVTTKTH